MSHAQCAKCSVKGQAVSGGIPSPNWTVLNFPTAQKHFEKWPFSHAFRQESSDCPTWSTSPHNMGIWKLGPGLYSRLQDILVLLIKAPGYSYQCSALHVLREHTSKQLSWPFSMFCFSPELTIKEGWTKDIIFLLMANKSKENDTVELTKQHEIERRRALTLMTQNQQILQISKPA